MRGLRERGREREREREKEKERERDRNRGTEAETETETQTRLWSQKDRRDVKKKPPRNDRKDNTEGKPRSPSPAFDLESPLCPEFREPTVHTCMSP
jgi:hypothetical protein